MADIRIPSPPAPGSWGEAFAALPAETPPGDGWQRVAAQLDARRRRRAPAWLGIAAAAGVVLAVGVWTARPDPKPALPAADPAPVAAAQSTQSTQSAQPATEAGDTATTVATGALRSPEVAVEPAPEAATRIAATPEPASRTRTAADPPADTAVAGLQRESAHLEALLALARDDSVGSAGAVLLADAFDGRLAGIDALLANPGLADEEREALWQARVDTLRQATGFTSTQRLLAAQGHGDAWLASVD